MQVPFFFFVLIRPDPRSTLFPYTTLFRSVLLVRYVQQARELAVLAGPQGVIQVNNCDEARPLLEGRRAQRVLDRKSTRLNSSHVSISYAVFCLKKKTARGATSPSPSGSPY